MSHHSSKILHPSVVEVLEGFVFLLIFFLVLSISKIASGYFSVLLSPLPDQGKFCSECFGFDLCFFFFSPLASRETGKIQG